MYNWMQSNSELIVNLMPGEEEIITINVVKKAIRIRFQPNKIVIE